MTDTTADTSTSFETTTPFDQDDPVGVGNDNALPSPDTDAAQAELVTTVAPEEDTSYTPIASKRGKGDLEHDVRFVTDAYVKGDFVPEKGTLTPHRISKQIQTADSLDKPPSVGAVAAVLDRWAKIGFAQVSEKPVAFVDYTDAGREHGLTALKAKYKEARKAMRAAEKAANAPAAEATPEPEPVSPDATPFNEDRVDGEGYVG